MQPLHLIVLLIFPWYVMPCTDYVFSIEIMFSINHVEHVAHQEIYTTSNQFII